jgi:predicted enzyme related to lactoylglutathione lyase
MATAPALDFVVFYVSALDASASYFGDVLCFTRVPAEDGPGFHFFTSGTGGISFGLMQAGAETPSAGTAELYINVADVSAARERVVGQQADATPIAERPFGSIFTVHTPDRLPLIVMQAPPAQG